MYAIRRTDGEPVGDEYTFFTTGGPDDWSPAENEAEDFDEEVEYELVKMLVERVGVRTFGTLTPPCDEYEGTDSPGKTWFELVIRHVSADEWPAHSDVTLKRFEEHADASRYWDAMPESFLFHSSYEAHEVKRHQLSIVTREYAPLRGDCDNCGRSYFKHIKAPVG